MIRAFYLRLFYFCIFLCSCNTSNRGIETLITNEKIIWGMSYKSLSTILNNGYEIKYFNSEQIGSKQNYVYLEGMFCKIPIIGVKFNFEKDSLTGYEIWIDNKSKQEMLLKYYNISSFLNKIGYFNAYTGNDAWILYSTGKDGEKKYVTDIFMLKKKNKILIHIHKMYSNKESIFIK